MTTKYMRIFSDIHLEFGPWEIPSLETDKDTVLIIAGDLHVGDRGVTWLNEAATRFSHVIYVLGNHEFYNESTDLLVPKIKKNTSANISVYHRQGTIFLGDVRFICATLWADMHNNNAHTKYLVEQNVNDFRMIRKQNHTSRFTASDCCGEHMIAKNFIRNELTKPHNGKTVVVTHFLPSFESVNIKFRNASDHHLNGYFMSNLDNIILDGKPDFWIHGHTHDSCEYMLGQTEVICNPRGYFPYQLNALFDTTMLVNLNE